MFVLTACSCAVNRTSKRQRRSLTIRLHGALNDSFQFEGVPVANAEHLSFDAPSEVREMPLGRAEVIEIGGGKVMRMTLQPGWRWSEHVKPIAGTELCEAPHFQYSISGRIGVRMADGTEFEVGPGEVSMLESGHDAWVVGDEQVVAIDWGGAHVWAKHD